MRDTSTDRSFAFKPRRGQKRDTASSTVVPIGARSKRRAVVCRTAVIADVLEIPVVKTVRGSDLNCLGKTLLLLSRFCLGGMVFLG